MSPTIRRRRHLPLLAVVVVSVLSVAGAVLGPGPAPAATDALTGFPAETGNSPRWVWPLVPPHPVVRAYAAPATPYSAGHRGIDVAADPGSTVLAPADGVVSFAGVVVDRPVVSLRHADGLVSSVEPVAAGVTTGAIVPQGQPVGVVASGGHCDGRCVHLGVRLFGEYVNPLALLATIERAVLLPMGR